MADRGASDRVLAEIVRRVRPEDVADRMVTTFRSQIAGYQRLPEPVVIGQILEISRRNVELFFRAILEGRDPTDDDLEPFRDSARDRAGEGMPLEDLLHAYRVGGRIGWQAVTGAAVDGEQDALLALAERMMDYVDRVSSVVAQAYLDQRQHLVSEEERRLRDLFEAIVADAPLAPSLLELAERMSFPLQERYRPFAQTLSGAGAFDHAELAAGMRARGVLALTEGERVSGLTPVDAGLGTGTEGSLVAIGEATPRAELSDALEEVRLLVDLGRRLGQTGELKPDAFLTELLLVRSPRLAALLRRRALHALEHDGAARGPELVRTLEAYLDCDLDRRRAAARLHVHPNTLDYRLRQVTELTGLDCGRARDLVVLSLALEQRALESAL